MPRRWRTTPPLWLPATERRTLPRGLRPRRLAGLSSRRSFNPEPGASDGAGLRRWVDRVRLRRQRRWWFGVRSGVRRERRHGWRWSWRFGVRGERRHRWRWSWRFGVGWPRRERCRGGHRFLPRAWRPSVSYPSRACRRLPVRGMLFGPEPTRTFVNSRIEPARYRPRLLGKIARRGSVRWSYVGPGPLLLAP